MADKIIHSPPGGLVITADYVNTLVGVYNGEILFAQPRCYTLRLGTVTHADYDFLGLFRDRLGSFMPVGIDLDIDPSCICQRGAQT